jgi:phage virion morphogenesis protein
MTTPSGFAIRISEQGLGAAASVLARLGSRAVRFDLLEVAGTIAESAARERIQETKSGPDGEPWAPWAARTARSRKDHHSLLSSAGHLRDSLAFEIAPDALSVAIGSALPYAAVHQLGSEPDEDGEGDIPARPYLGLSPEQQAEVERASARRLEDFISGRRR